MAEERKFSLVDPPHLSSGETVPRAMLDVILALVPVSLVAVYFYRLNALFLIGVCVASAIATDYVVRRIRGKQSTLGDLSVVLTGFILALCFSPTTNWWTAAFATILAIAVGKEWMGGLGWNRFNPAAFGRVGVILLAPVVVFLNRQFAGLDVSFSMSSSVVDSVSGATPLATLKLVQLGLVDDLGISYGQLLLANPGGGALAESSVLALLIGGAYLLYRQHISWHIPLSILVSVIVLTTIMGQNPVHHVLTGGLMLGALFMATDWVTSPITNSGRIIFGALIGLLVVVFRLFLGPTEGVAFAILIMNAAVPLIDRLTKRAVFGEVVASKAT